MTIFIKVHKPKNILRVLYENVTLKNKGKQFVAQNLVMGECLDEPRSKRVEYFPYFKCIEEFIVTEDHNLYERV